ncbi:MAG: site-2 protease family protein, partial [Clostridia bacterium]|nr:site-2 protease family protein [Clostridia bacterium]
MTIINNFIENLPQILLSLPIVLIALSFHELAHGFVAMKLGDNTAKNLGRLTMNPLKHIDIIGFISMVLFHFGWAKPVPIQSRNFRKPRRDMALTGLAGPVSNIILAIISVLLLRLVMLIMGVAMPNEINLCIKAFFQGSFSTISASVPFIIMSIISFMLYLGVILNLSLALFNLIPIP